MASSGSGVRIGLRGVSKRYMTASGDAVAALGEIDLDVAAGEFVSIVGPSGCGKSTLMMLVSGLIPATTGTITVGGVPVKGAGGKAGIVFQRDVLLDWRTVFSNVMLPVEIKRLDKETHLKKARDLLRSVGLAEFEEKYPAERSRSRAFLRWRSEEHTSELQSQSNLVCRLLLEKKKQQTIRPPPPD